MSEPKEIQNSGRLCSVWCPECRVVTEKVSFNLLREAGTVNVICPRCGGLTNIVYNGKSVRLSYISGEGIELLDSIKNDGR
jgi:Zn finger protein HypA/HybF involved in hydrogenase expression